jgi:nucleotide-binding universal stress UspA family protein
MEREQKPYVIVVGVDYSETGELAFRQAYELAAAHPVSELHVVNVVRLVVAADEFVFTPLMAYASMTLGQAEEDLAQYVCQKEAEFRGKLDGSRNAPPRVIPHVRLEAEAREIAQLAADLEANLVVVGTHGRRALARVVLGSVAEVVVRLAPCPVLVVRPQRLVEPPRIEPPCRECLKARKQSAGERQCPQHSERHGQRHTYHQDDRSGTDGTMPLVFRS